jgi:AcrR family transcriptional regulator
MGERALRADARRNRERVLAAAQEVFAESGPGAPIDAVADRAGVGPGTVYRHFPTKEALFEAVVQARVEDLVADAAARAGDPDAGAAFFGFLSRLADEAVVKRDVSEALAGPVPVADDVRQRMFAALDVLLQRAQESGAVRTDVRTVELIALVKGLISGLQAADDRHARDVLVAVVTDGLRSPRGQP